MKYFIFKKDQNGFQDWIKSIKRFRWAIRTHQAGAKNDKEYTEASLLTYNGEYYYALHYIFPGLLRRDLMMIIDPYVIPHMYEVKDSFCFFDLTLVVSFVCLATSSIFIIKERYDRKKLEIEKENS